MIGNELKLKIPLRPNINLDQVLNLDLPTLLSLALPILSKLDQNQSMKLFHAKRFYFLQNFLLFQILHFLKLV